MAINYYNYYSEQNTRISDHFTVGEFAARSDYGGDYPSEIPIDSELPVLLERVYEHFGCDCAVISSGYRTPEVDREVGGSGYGYHTQGMAADVCFYKNGAQIHSRLIACFLQDIGVNGIGYRCGGAEYWTHIDTRQGSVWHGDEIDYSITVDDYYSYTGTSRAEVYGDGGTSDGGDQTGGGDVASVQAWLNDNYSAGLEVDGVFGALTKAALVRALQTELNLRGAELEVDGIFGPCTKSAVYNLSTGDSGNLVYILQGLLLCNGYGAGGFDGVFGGGTEAAVTTYQYQHALDADGIAGQQTFESLCS